MEYGNYQIHYPLRLSYRLTGRVGALPTSTQSNCRPLPGSGRTQHQACTNFGLVLVGLRFPYWQQGACDCCALRPHNTMNELCICLTESSTFLAAAPDAPSPTAGRPNAMTPRACTQLTTYRHRRSRQRTNIIHILDDRGYDDTQLASKGYTQDTKGTRDYTKGATVDQLHISSLVR